MLYILIIFLIIYVFYYNKETFTNVGNRNLLSHSYILEPKIKELEKNMQNFKNNIDKIKNPVDIIHKQISNEIEKMDKSDKK